MIRRSRASRYRWLTGLLPGGLSFGACAHAFDERYDLPAPLSYFIAGATAAVALSFVVTALFARRSTGVPDTAPRLLHIGGVLPALRRAGGVLGVALLALTIAAGFFGTRDPVMNFSPVFVWIVWWVGLSICVACVGDVWPAVDPWRNVFLWIDRTARRRGRCEGVALHWPYPRVAGAWPAVFLLLFMGWFEVVYPEGAEPYRIAGAALAWTAVTLIGSVCFGIDAWRNNADVFAIYFSTLGRFAPLTAGPDTRTLTLRPPGRGLLEAQPASLARVAFVIAMLAIVLFDGLLSGEAWYAAQARVMRAIPLLANPGGAIAGAFGLVVLWLILFGGYALACAIASALVREGNTRSFLRLFAFSLVPIAIGYEIAHNASSVLIQGQHFIALVSDPLGRHWDLFGTAGYRTDIGIIDARTTWYVAIASIVAGHVWSIWLAHRMALREIGPARAVAACVPLTLLMLLYTAVSLSIIAEPMTKFEPLQDPSASVKTPQTYQVVLFCFS